MKNLEADWLSQWALIWRRDDRYHTPLDHVYFDLRDGGVHWVLGDEGAVPDAEIRQLEAEFITAPVGWYEEIAALTHGEHHEIFRRWLQTLPEKVRDPHRRTIPAAGPRGARLSPWRCRKRALVYDLPHRSGFGAPTPPPALESWRIERRAASSELILMRLVRFSCSARIRGGRGR